MKAIATFAILIPALLAQPANCTNSVRKCQRCLPVRAVTRQTMNASPISDAIGGRQIVAVAARNSLDAFAPAEQYSARQTGAIVQLEDVAHQTTVSIMPSRGNVVFEMKVKGHDVVQWPGGGIPLLAPWANRLDEHAFYANGKRYAFDMELGNVRGPVPIHGFLQRTDKWQVIEAKPDASSAWVVSRLEFSREPDWMRQWPFAHTIEMTHVVRDGTLEVRTKITNSAQNDDLLARVDHLVYATPDLTVGIEKLEKLLGVRGTPGGQHPGRGTRNALISLEPRTYIEIIGPDPDQPKPAQPRPFGIDTLLEPRLVTWAANETDLARLSNLAVQANIPLGELAAGSRRRPDGVLLTWNYTNPRTVVADGIVPFFIDWGKTPHPAQSAATVGQLVALAAEHPDPERVAKSLRQLGLHLVVKKGPQPALIATISGPRGRVELR